MAKPLERFGFLLMMNKALYRVAKSLLTNTFRWSGMVVGRWAHLPCTRGIFYHNTSPQSLLDTNFSQKSPIISKLSHTKKCLDFKNLYTEKGKDVKSSIFTDSLKQIQNLQIQTPHRSPVWPKKYPHISSLLPLSISTFKHRRASLSSKIMQYTYC